MNYLDNPFSFRQDSSFLYYWGLDSPGLSAIMDIDEGRDMVFGDDFTVEEIVWVGPQETLRERAQKTGINLTAPAKDLEATVKKATQKGRKILFLPQYRAENILGLERLLGIYHTSINDYVSKQFIKAVVSQRSVKSEEEIREIEAALDITYEMHTMAMKMAKPGMCEREVAGAMEGMAVSMGGQIAYPIIFSIHGETLHNHYHGNVMKAGDIAVNDSGAESAMHYAADITRTIPIGGKFSGRQTDIYRIVLEAQDEAMKAVKPDVKFRDVHLLACRIIASGLKDIGLMKGDVAVAVKKGAHALFFQCGTGHMMGLDVHDMESLGEDNFGYDDKIQRSDQFGLKSLRLAKALRPGFVVTVEPGIYFIPELIDQWKASNKFSDFINYEMVEEFRAFGGMRVEDDLLVVENGNRILGKKIPKTIEEVEQLSSQ